MKRMVFGVSLFFGGLFGSLSILIASIFRPVVYNGVDGLKGFLISTNLTSVYDLLRIILFIGLIIMIYEAYLSSFIKDRLKSLK